MNLRDSTQHRDTWGDLRYIRDLGGVAEHSLPASALQQRILPLLSSFGGFGKPSTYLWDLLAEAVPDDLRVAAPQHPVHLVTELRVGLCVRVQASATVICLVGSGCATTGRGGIGGYFLVSQDALEVMGVSHSLTHSLRER